MDEKTLASGGLSTHVMTWKWEHEEEDTLITLSFKPSGKGTEIVLLHENFATSERRDSHQNGWIGTFDRLARYVA